MGGYIIDIETPEIAGRGMKMFKRTNRVWILLNPGSGWSHWSRHNGYFQNVLRYTYLLHSIPCVVYCPYSGQLVHATIYGSDVCVSDFVLVIVLLLITTFFVFANYLSDCPISPTTTSAIRQQWIYNDVSHFVSIQTCSRVNPIYLPVLLTTSK